MTNTRPFFYAMSMALLGAVSTAIATPVPTQASADMPTTTAPITASQTRHAQKPMLHTRTPVVKEHRQPQALNRTAKAGKPVVDHHLYAPQVGRPMAAYQNAVTPPPVGVGR